MRLADDTRTDRAADPEVRHRRVTYVLPVFNESENIAVFHAALIGATSSRPDLDFAFVYVDDGSRDDSLERLLALRQADPRVTVLGLSRNFGHQIAVTAGLDAAVDSDAVIVMDTDLQDPPRVSMDMVAMWEGGVDVVYAQRRSRRDSLFKRSSAYAFYWVLDRLASIEIPRNVGDFRLMDRRVVAEVARYREHDRFLRGIVANVGFRQEALLFDRDPRHAGTTGYPLRKMLSFAASGILGFSTAPLKMISRLGVVISGLSVLLATYVLWVRLTSPATTVPGWAFLGVGMFLLSGLQLIMMGVIGSYLGRVYVEAQNRPLYSVALTARGDPAGLPAIRRQLAGRG
ncbi:MAG: glycosyltransferase [Nocardioides sp.]|nr:glycosyltransferase [Nocardioides sp.]